MSFTITVKWDGTPGGWWGSAKFTLTNNSTAPLDDPKIEFAVQSRQKVEKNAGIEIQRATGSNHVTGRLESWLSKIPAGKTVEFSVAISPADGKEGLGELPTDIKVNGQGGETPPPKERPDAPQNLRVVKSTKDTLEFAWDAVSWPGGIRGYWISWSQAEPSRHGGSEEITATTYRITGLTPNSMYGISVTAIGNDNKNSPIATTHGRTKIADDPKPPPGDRNWEIQSAPFCDGCVYPTPQFDLWQAKSDVDGYFIGFMGPLLDKTSGKVRAAWAGLPTMYDAHEKVTHSGFLAESNYLKGRITELQRRGCQVILSAGGSTMPPLEEKMPAAEAVEEYIRVLDNYATNYLDFDVEGTALTNPELMDRHVEVLLTLRNKRPDVRISHTFAVDVDGWNHHTIALVKKIAASGYVPDVVMGMLMEMRDPDSNYWLAAKRSSETMITQMTADWAWGSAWTTRDQAFKHFGMCPMFGVNNNRKLFTPDHMRSLVRYATDNNVAVVSGWDAWRDHNQFNPEAGISPPCGLDVKNIYACTHVQQKPGEFADIVGTFPLMADPASIGSALHHPCTGAAPESSTPGRARHRHEYDSDDGALPEVPNPECPDAPTVNVTVNVDLR